MTHDIFVSYSTQDKLFADALVHRLEQAGYRCWYAPRDIAAGVSWPQAISRAIREIPLMLLVFSGSSNRSEEVSRELTLASSNKRIVMPVRIEDVQPGVGLEYHLADRHWLDVHGLEEDAAISRVLGGLERYASVFAGVRSSEVSAPTVAPSANATAKKKSFGWRAASFLLVLLAAAITFFVWQGRPRVAPEDAAPALAPHATVFTGNNGVTIAVAPTADGKAALLRVQGINHPIDNVVFLAEKADDGRRTYFRITLDGRTWGLVGSENASSRTQAWLPGIRDEMNLSYDEKASGALDLALLAQAYEKQKQEGIQARLARFDRDKAVARAEAKIKEADDDASRACGVAVKTTINWNNINEDQLKRLSIGGFCATVVDSARRICSGNDSDPFRGWLAGNASITCQFGDKLALDVQDGRIVFTTAESEPNQDDFAMERLRAQILSKNPSISLNSPVQMTEDKPVSKRSERQAMGQAGDPAVRSAPPTPSRWPPPPIVRDGDPFARGNPALDRWPPPSDVRSRGLSPMAPPGGLGVHGYENPPPNYLMRRNSR